VGSAPVRIVATVEVSGDGQAGLSSGGTNEVENLLIAVERFAGPVLGDLRKETMLDGVPFRSSCLVVGDGEGQAVGIGQLRLELGFPSAATIAVTAAGIAEDEEMSGAWITEQPLLAPPMRDGVSGEGGCVMGDTDHDRPSMGEQIIDAVRDGDARGIGAEVVIVDQAGTQIPARTGIFEIADQFTFFGIDANDGETAALKSVSKIAEVEELMVAIGTVIGGEFLVIDAQGIAHLMEETSDRVGTDDDAEVSQRPGNLVRRSPLPLQTRNGVTGGVVFQQELD
jgi:hypothetical protein